MSGFLGPYQLYELGRIELFKDVFLWAYERSALRYAAIRQSLGEPDAFRLTYREEIRRVIAAIISGAMSQEEALKTIRETAQKVPPSEQRKFVEIVETELLALHEGNYARYRVKPSEFSRWKDIWERP
ncbi:hypothetical protein BLX24_29585 [Arsenicibacter rosenii]|uniref:Uncharacterized protein n=1 Tax=Arsenicibacter rosenii TaxID=1750698 RepID=A0A1S2VA53_9BACT|nr:hypothetical protein BLX24_29585 [Arsenicibacter rosenii]